ncbi:hypothetical protein B0H19DRAFT_342662 [Mycena capillaripes]|nr:hypothetical protein B0H19DRAFT_342662 [Mycena capillaripes]
MSRDIDASITAEHELSLPEMPQFSASLFTGPCFGDLSPSESSATFPDAPSPSPLLLNSLPNSNPIQSEPDPATGDLIEFSAPEESTSDLQNRIYDPLPVTSLMDSTLIYHEEPVQSTATSFLSPLPLDDSSDLSFSSTLITVDEPSLSEPCNKPINSDPNHPSNTDEDVFDDLTSAELRMLDESSLSKTADLQTQTMPVDVASGGNADTLVPPSSSPLDEPASSPPFPLTPPASSNSETPANDIDPSTDPPLPSATLYEPEITDFSTSLPYSSPPSSSPELIFSSSPPAASDSSAYDHEDFPAPKAATFPSVDSTDLSPSSSPPQHFSSSQMHDPESLNQDGFNGPPSSSPMPSSSPSYPQSTKLQTDGVDIVPFSSNIAFSVNSMQLSGTPSEMLFPTPDLGQKDSLADVSPSSLTSAPMDVGANFSGQKNDEVLSSHKRKREEEAAPEEETREEISTQPPNPKRPTLASQKLQRKTLIKPFRSPAMVAPKAADPVPPPPPPKKETASVEQPHKDDLKKHRTQRASGQFKSPLPLAVSSSIPTAVRQTPTIQALERKVQVLRRAVKVKKGGEEQTLEALVKKWTEAGREVAWEVWGLVKDNENGSSDDWGKDSQNATSGKRRLEDSWGWNEDLGSKRIKVEDSDRNWGWSVSPTTATDDRSTDQDQSVEPAEEDKPRETLGTMLMRLGIAPATLGWNDDEEEFVDE